MTNPCALSFLFNAWFLKNHALGERSGPAFQRDLVVGLDSFWGVGSLLSVGLSLKYILFFAYVSVDEVNDIGLVFMLNLMISMFQKFGFFYYFLTFCFNRKDRKDITQRAQRIKS